MSKVSKRLRHVLWPDNVAIFPAPAVWMQPDAMLYMYTERDRERESEREGKKKGIPLVVEETLP